MNPKSLLRLIVRPLLGFASRCLRGLGILLLLLAMPASAAITAGTISFGTGHGSFADVSSDYNGLRFTGEWVYYTDSDLTTGFGGVRVPGSTGDTITSTASSGNAIIKSANGTDRFSLTSVKIFAYGVGMTQFTFAGYRNGSPTGSSDTVNVTSATSSFVNFNLSNMTDVDEVRVSNNSPAEAFNFAFDDMAVTPYAASLSLSPTTLSAATVAAAYNQTITASGGTSPYTYAVTAGALPAGMGLSSAGVLSGTPTAGGSFNFTITATDSTGGTPVTGSQAYTLTVNAPTISVSPTSLADGTLSVAYSQAITASGGTAPYTYAITAGALPAGLSLSSGGSLSGTPVASGTFNFTVTATDSSTGTGPYAGARAYALTILAAPTATTGAASTITTTGATLGGTVSSNGASTTVTFDYGLDTNYGSPATASQSPLAAGASGSSVSAAITGLSCNTTYHFRVTAVNSVGTTNGSDATFTTSPCAPIVTTGSATSITASGATLGGTVSSGGASTTVTFEYGLTTGYGSSASASQSPLSAGASNSSVSAAISSLSCGTTYHFRATASNSAGTTNGSDATFATVACSAPGAPTIGTATAGDAQASVTFTPPASDGGSAITGYTVISNPPGGVDSNAGTTGLSHVVTGLTNGTAYTFTVTATNGVGTGIASAASNSVTPKAPQTITFNNPGAQNFGTSPTLTATATSGLTSTFTSSTTGVCTITPSGALTFVTAGSCTINADQAGDASHLAAPQVSQTFTVNAVQPGAPTIGTATAGDTQASVAFTAPTNTGGTAITGYTVTVSPPDVSPVNGASSPIVVTGLTNGQAYTFTVTATNLAGTGPASASSNSVTPRAAQTITFANPGAQNFGTSPTLSASSDSGLSVSFTSSTIGVCTITTGGVLTFVTAGSCTIDANQAGNASYLPATQISRTFTVNPVAPGVPTGVSATAGNTQATVSFSPPASNGGATITGYTATSNPGGLTGLCASSPCTVTGLTNGTTYTFTVTATNVVATGGASIASSGVTPTDAPPVANAVSATVTYGSSGNPITLSITGSYSSVAVASAAANGTASVSGMSISYSPNAGYSGTDSFTYTATNAGGTSAPATVTITVSPQLPVAGAVAATVTYGSSGNAIGLILSGGTPTSVAVASAPANGTATASGAGISYTPNPTFSGTDSFTYTATNAGGTSAPATVTITVSPQLPVAGAVTDTVAYGSSGNPVALILSGGTATSVAVASQAAHGTATASGTSISYTPNAGYSGSDSFTYTATNAGGTSAPATVTITVSPQLPVAGAVAATVAYGSSGNAITLALSGGTATSVAVAGQAAHGTATVSGTSISYTPNAGYSGSDSFTYTATNAGGTSAPATVTITVSPQLPVAGAVTTAVDFGSSNNVIALPLSGGTATSVAVASQAAHGTATAIGASISYTPNPTFSGTDSFTYTATNAGGTSAPATVTITVNPQTPVAGNVTILVEANSSANLVPLALSGGAASSVAVATAPANGTASVSGTEIRYTPNADFSGNDSFTYTATNAGGTSAPATVSVTVRNRPDPSKDAEVKGLLHAQAATAKRFAQAQITNFQTHLEGLHGRMRRPVTGGDTVASRRAEPVTGSARAPSPRSGSASSSTSIGSGLAYRQAVGLPGDKAGTDPYALPQKQDYRQLQSLLPWSLSSLNLASTRRDVYGSGLDVWTAGSINIGRQPDEDLRFTTSGVSMGADKRFGDTWVLGAGAGFGHERQKVGNQGSRSDGNAYSLAVYGSYQPIDGLFLDGLLGHATLDFDTRRHVTGIGSEALASRKGTQWFASLTAAYEVAKGRELFAPYARLDLARTHLKQATERGAGAYDLVYFAQDSESTKLALGLRGETEIQLGNGSMSPYFRVEYQREFDDGGVAEMSYADSLSGPIYRLDGPAVDRDTLVLGLGSQWMLQRVWNLGLGYRYSHGSASTRVHGFTASIKRRF